MEECTITDMEEVRYMAALITTAAQNPENLSTTDTEILEGHIRKCVSCSALLLDLKKKESEK